MSAQAVAPQFTLEQVVTKILTTRKISRLDQRLLMFVSGQTALTPQQEDLLRQVYELLHRGLLKVIN